MNILGGTIPEIEEAKLQGYVDGKNFPTVRAPDGRDYGAVLTVHPPDGASELTYGTEHDYASHRRWWSRAIPVQYQSSTLQSGTAGYLHLSTAVPDWVEDHHLYNSTRSTTLCNVRGVSHSHSNRSIDHQLENESYINLFYTVVDRYVSKQLRGVIPNSKFFLIYRILTSCELT